VEYLGIADGSLVNTTEGAISILTNRGTIQALNVSNIFAKAVGGKPRGYVLRNSGTIGEKHLTNVITRNMVAVEE
jgi:hypothetical protein